MNKLFLILLPALPLAFGVLIALVKKAGDRTRSGLFIGALGVQALLTAAYLFMPDATLHLFSMTPTLTVELGTDGVSRLFLGVTAAGFLLTGVFTLRYMRSNKLKATFYSCMLFTLSALVGMYLSKNLITMYLFFEAATLVSVPLVLHDRTEEASRAALKYLFYSIAGAFIALLAIFILALHTPSLDFAPGGMLNASNEHRTLIEVVVFLACIGFGAKAGLYPLHGWLPTAHPTAPAPASAVLSGIIAKAGVLAILRLLFYVVGADFLRGSWVQYALTGLALLTVFMGSMMAFREDLLKKRLAYSTVSQVSYILLGLFLMTENSVAGGLMHLVFHACIKICLFLCAGSIISNLKLTRVSELTGIGKSMPVTTLMFTIASLGLIGIPPSSGFVSKWYLALGSLDSGLPVISWLAPVILLVSALLTAGYLLPITVRGFFPGKDFPAPARSDEGTALMWLPISVLAVVSLLLGIFATPLTSWLLALAGGIV